MADQKTEKASPQRLRKAREEGRFPASRDLLASAQLTLTLLVAYAIATNLFRAIGASARLFFVQAFSGRELSTTSMVAIARQGFFPPIRAMFALTGIAAGLGLLIQIIANGFGLAFKQAMPDFSRISPGKRLRSLPSQNLFSFAKAVCLLPIIVLILYVVLWPELDRVLNLSTVALTLGLADAADITKRLLWRLLFVLLAFGVIDFVRQRRRFLNDLRMTKKEVKEEAKENDGNPLMKMRVRRRQRERSRKRMMSDLPKASVVVVNPTHYAVAIRYEFGSKGIPQVLAKGKDYLALAIRKRARELEIPIVENKDLARALHDAVEVGQVIPPHLYRAVAEILAHIYRTTANRPLK